MDKGLINYETYYAQIERPISEILEKLAEASFSPQKGSGKIFKELVHAAFIKNLEYANLCLLKTTPDDAYFFLMSSLRSSVEDLIILSYLNRLTDEQRNSYAVEHMNTDVINTIKSQQDFFLKEGRATYALRMPLHRDKMPKSQLSRKTTESMAKTVSLDWLYEFMFRSTSRSVHFSPSLLLRTGWGNIEGDILHIKFTTANFSNYYKSFCVVYSTYISYLFFIQLKEHIQYSSQIEINIKKLRRLMFDLLRLPEAVTPEEMNLEVKPVTAIQLAMERLEVENLAIKEGLNIKFLQ